MGQKALIGFRWEQIVELNYLYWAADKETKKQQTLSFQEINYLY